ncbi:MAG: nucleotidyltransferase domain-containing protein [Desulfotignum sp.]
MQTKSALLQEIEKRINAYISDSIEAKQSITIVYLYGSVLHPEKFRHKSDIDLAFLLDPSLYKKDPLIYSTPAYMAATEIGLMANRQTDVNILNAASIETAYQAITTGIVLYETDHENRLEYESLVRGLYFDFKPFLQNLRAKSMHR